MTHFALSPGLVWPIAALATGGVLFKPFRLAEAWWPCAGAILLLATGQLTFGELSQAVGKGTDVYLFLIGMMLIAELARTTGLFDWVAALAVRRAQGSAARLFVIVYLVGTVVTIFMSNDATAVVLTPAVLAAAQTAKLKKPLPHLFACALIANAASFVLPVSNPANLVVFSTHMPDLLAWMRLFLVPSFIAIVVTFGVLYWSQRADLAGRISSNVEVPALKAHATIVAGGIAVMATALLTASALGIDLGLPTCIVGAVTFALIMARSRPLALSAARDMSWSVLPLVAGLFVLVAAMAKIGVSSALARWLQQLQDTAPEWTVWATGGGTAIVSNVVNNLPAGLLAGATLSVSHVPDKVMATTLVGIDLGPNLSVTGSLATVLWLTALRRADIEVSFLAFLKIGCIAMPVALLACLFWLALL